MTNKQLALPYNSESTNIVIFRGNEGTYHFQAPAIQIANNTMVKEKPKNYNIADDVNEIFSNLCCKEKLPGYKGRGVIVSLSRYEANVEKQRTIHGKNILKIANNIMNGSTASKTLEPHGGFDYS